MLILNYDRINKKTKSSTKLKSSFRGPSLGLPGVCNFNAISSNIGAISLEASDVRDKMHFVTSVCVKRYVARHEHMSRSYSSKSRSYRLYRTCACHEYICREHPTPHKITHMIVNHKINRIE